MSEAREVFINELARRAKGAVYHDKEMDFVVIDDHFSPDDLDAALEAYASAIRSKAKDEGWIDGFAAGRHDAGAEE